MSDRSAVPPTPPRCLPAHALAWSEARLDEPPPSVPSLALWLPDGMTVALGISQDATVEADTAAMDRDCVGLIRRQSGGGAVLLYDGVICWEAWAGLDCIGELGGSGIRETYRVLCTPIVTALGNMGISAFHAGICDISHTCPDGRIRKIAGTAQMRRRGMALVHGSLLVHPDISVLGQYLRQPSDEPDYRDGRRHSDFCTTVQALVRSDDSRAVFGSVTSGILAAVQTLGWDSRTIPDELDPSAQRLYRDKYSQISWNKERKRPTNGEGRTHGSLEGD